jgi:hypothetical protein
MYNLDEVINFIENKYKFKLLEYQKQMLDYIIKGYTFSCPIRSGRKMILNGFIDYLKEIHGKHIDGFKAQKHFLLEDIMKENNWYEERLKELQDNNIKFETEYQCEWLDNKYLKETNDI